VFLSWIIACRWAQSESRQTLRAIVRNSHVGDLFKRTVRLSGVAHQFRGIPIDLVEIRAIWRNPVIAGAAANGSVDRSEGAVSRNARARRILCDADLVAVDVVAANVAVTEEGLPALVSIGTSGLMSTRPSASMLLLTSPLPAAMPLRKVLGRPCRKAI
jgi:hypothetical protein